MKSDDLRISELNGGFAVSVRGRAIFDYAVPLRELAGKLSAGCWLQIDLENCEAMDSTFMGVLTMLALKMKKNGSQVMLLGANDNLKKLLQDLGVAKLFKFADEKIADANSGNVLPTIQNNDMLTTAQTVAEAHKTLVEADNANAEKFKQVIEFADQDIARLKQQK